MYRALSSNESLRPGWLLPLGLRHHPTVIEAVCFHKTEVPLLPDDRPRQLAPN